MLIIEKRKKVRELIIRMAASPTGCHIGGSLSVADILIAVYDKFHNDLAQTSVVLSKGHSAAALYAVLYTEGIVQDDPSETYGRKNSIYTGHPNHHISGIPFSTGSLGHGIPYAIGHSLAQKLLNKSGLGIVITGDGELQEGLCWEAFQIAQAKKINNFIAIVDCNGGQNDGLVGDISPLDIESLKMRFLAFGFEAVIVDGHNIQEVQDQLLQREKPLAILARTIKGYGVRALENNPDSHYAVLKPALASKWIGELYQ